MKNQTLLVFALLLFGHSLSGAISGQTKLVGQVVCSTCWFEAPDRKTSPYGNAADIQCAVDCSELDIPQALAVEDAKGFTLYILEPGRYKPAKKDFLDLVPKTVEVEGEVRVEKDKRIIKVNALRVLETPASKPAPVPELATLSLKDLTGAEQSLAGLRGRIVVLNFWATWCEPCRKEMPDLASIQNDYAPFGVQVIGAAGDPAAQSATVLKFIREVKVNFPVWIGASADDMERFGVGRVLPATVVIDQQGKIVWREISIIKPDALRKELDKLLLPKVSQAEKAAIAQKSKTRNASLVPA